MQRAKSIVLKKRLLYLLIFLFLTLSIDQCSKEWARVNLKPEISQDRYYDRMPVKVIVKGYLELRYSENPGSAFGLFRSMDHGRMILFFLSVLCLVILVICLLVFPSRTASVGIKFGLLAGGALGNTLDRLRFGRVVDFVVVKISLANGVIHEWPTFNLADLALVSVTVLFVIGSIREFIWPHGKLSPFRSTRVFLGMILRLVVLPFAAIGGGALVVLKNNLTLLGTFLAICLLSIAAAIYRAGARLMQPTGEEARRLDSRPPVLLLRAFFRDEEEVIRPWHWMRYFSGPFDLKDRATFTFEEALVDLLKERGPVIALGRPDERMQPAGAARDYVDAGNWKSKVQLHVSEASLIVLIPDGTESIRWELTEVADRALNRLLIVLPPTFRGAAKQREDEWYETWKKLRSEFAFLPHVDDNTVAVSFIKSGCFVIKGTSSKLQDQLRAMSHFLEETS